MSKVDKSSTKQIVVDDHTTLLISKFSLKELGLYSTNQLPSRYKSKIIKTTLLTTKIVSYKNVCVWLVRSNV